MKFSTLLLVSVTLFLYSHDRHGVSAYKYKIDFYETLLDHFTFTSNRTFALRYLYNDDYWGSKVQHHSGYGHDHSGGGGGKGPIFLYTGGESDIEETAASSGFLFDIAPSFGALILFVEHRYYGSSLPFGNVSLISLDPTKSGYLTSEQALGDFADFISHFKAKNNAYDSPVISFGGSYPGMLTTWFRIKYPHLVQGGIASSAPILQFIGMKPCNTFAVTITDAYRQESLSCVESVRRSWSIINKFGSSSAGRAWLSSNWKTCSPILTPGDLWALKNWLRLMYGRLAMGNYPYPVGAFPALPVKEFCKRLLRMNPNPNHNHGYGHGGGHSDEERLNSLFNAMQVRFNFTGQASCFSSFTTFGTDTYAFQNCTELVMARCYDNVHDFFEAKPYDYKVFEADCIARWGVVPRPKMGEINYGGSHLSAASNIVFTNGLLDPWSRLGILESINPSVVAIIIPSGAHHIDLRGSNPADPPDVLHARQQIQTHIKKWIKEFHHHTPPNCHTY